MEWNDGTEVPRNYFFWAALSSIAATVNGQIWIRQGKFVHYPNMYIVLLGPPANGKTVAIDRAEEIVREIDDIAVSGQSETAEGLIRHMRDKCVRQMVLPPPDGAVSYTPISLYLSELSNFFGKDPAGMIDLLTGIWDRGGRTFHRRTKGQGEDMIPRPNVNLLSGTTPAWITQYLKTDIVGGGFTRRIVFANEPRRDPAHRVAWPEDTPAQKNAKARCVLYGKRLRSLIGEVQYTDGAKKAYIDWYNTRPPATTEEEEGYHGSKPSLMLKVAMLLAVSREPKLVITEEDVKVALALLEASELHRQRVFQAVGRNILNALASRVTETLLATDPIEAMVNGNKIKVRAIPEKHLRMALYKDAPGKELDDIMLHLERTEKIYRANITLPNNPPRVFIVLKE